VTASKRLPDDAPGSMLFLHYSSTSIGKTVWMEREKAEKLAASLRRKGHNVEIVSRKGARQ
jgi:hypothetical protein